MSERFWVEATGVCMWPAVREGDLLLCEPLGSGVPNPGEVLVAHDGRGFVAHRLHSARLVRGKERLLLKADLGESDRPRGREEILGRVLLVYRQEEGLTDVTTSLRSELEVGPFTAAILRRVARWHTDAIKVRNALRNRDNTTLELPNVPRPAARSPDPGHLARTRAAAHGGIRHADLSGST
jgi:hypothetical protein